MHRWLLSIVHQQRASHSKSLPLLSNTFCWVEMKDLFGYVQLRLFYILQSTFSIVSA